MKIIIGKDSLLDSLSKVFNIVPQKPTLPVLSNFLIKAQAGRLHISGYDMDISITTSTECQVDREGEITVNAKRFMGVIRELPQGDIEIDAENERVTIIFKNGQSSILGMPSSDYPALKESIDGISVNISGDDFREMVGKTSFSVSQDRTRLALTGILWKVASDEMVMVATDGHRLSLFGRKMKIETEGGTEVIVSPKTLNQAAQIISGGTEIEKIIFGDGAIFFDFGDTKIYSKLLEGPYPNFRQVIPTGNSKKVYVSKTELDAAVRRVSVLSNTITHQVKVSISSGIMELATKNDDIGGESRETVEIRYDGEPMTAGYNAAFLSEIIRRTETDEVLMEMESSTTACIIKPVDMKETDENIYLIMPLRLSE